MTRTMFNLLRSSQFRPPFRKVFVLLMVVTLSWTTIACGGPNAENTPSKSPTTNQAQQKKASNTVVADGKYDVQQASYNDGDGEYTLFLLNTPPGVPATFQTNNLQMAQLTAEEVTAAAQAYLQVQKGQAALHIPKDFKLEYTHNVVEAAENPQTGQTETRVVRQESNFWSPFAGALAGQVVGNLLFSPRHYVPPMYQSGGMMGYGGYGNSYGQAVDSYRQRYQAPPAAERNRTVYRSTRRSNTGFGSAPARSGSSASSQRSTGKGFGSSNLRKSSNPSSSSYRRSPSSGFGSGRSSGFSRSGGRRR
jgi:hypothetical protein